ncbi:MAG: peptidase M14 [Halobacteriovoraceae bacterium]|nr:peptidase M14 [Halobacteriovoraceae bacterium]|tara:strand:- start:11519 stop:12523 length:1005 start_codon:yes stop_codon:yes gene_type:complete
MKYKFCDHFPENLENIDIKDIHKLLDGPTLIHIRGRRDDALYLSTLLHGNETTSFLMLQRLIKKYREVELPRDLIIFIGNTEAAACGMRHLPGQADYNRIWEEGFTPENELAMDVINYAKEQNIFASLDIHNNTGKNPHYGCINVLNEQFIDLASHFGSHTVYFTEPHNVQSMAFSKFCTSITIESGKPGLESGTRASFEFVDKIFNMDKLEANPARENPEIFHTFARMLVDENANIDFENTPCVKNDLSFLPDIDENNFEVLTKGTQIGFARDKSFISVKDDFGKDLTDDFLKFEEGKILLNRTFIPSMFTKDVFVMKEDCLGYIMELMIPTT